MSFVRSLVIAAVASAGFAGVAYARDPVFTVKLSAPLAEPTRVIAQSTIWNCDGDTCVARPSHASSVRACRQFLRQAGDVRVIAYGPEGGELSAEELARCNGDESVRQSLEAAVYRASPLPQPADPSLFERSLVVTFRPE